jgi:hypothetical protein
MAADDSRLEDLEPAEDHADDVQGGARRGRSQGAKRHKPHRKGVVTDAGGVRIEESPARRARASGGLAPDDS